MNISFIAPLERSWARMRGILFSPFRIETWMVLGFSAWLAGLVDGCNSSGGSQYNLDEDGFNPSGAWEGAGNLVQSILENAIWIIIALVVLALTIGFLLFCLWASSRAKFVFLDNVVRGHSQFVDPWRAYARLGNSLFLWRLGFLILCLLALMLAGILILVVAGIDLATAFEGRLTVAAVVMLSLVGLALVVPIAYIQLYLDSFIVPLMYRFNITTTEAWLHFLDLFRRQFMTLLLYGFFILGLSIVFMTALVAFSIMTCCIGAILLALPYIGTVVLLPVWVTYRAYSVEFLEQFGDQYKLFAVPAPPAPPRPPAPPSPPPPPPPAPEPPA